MAIVVLHAYSRSNSGDGLLVDLTVKRLSRLFPEDRVIVIAQDPESFPEYDAHSWTARYSLAPSSSRLSTAQVLVTGPNQELSDYLSSARLIVGVGGGYLRASAFVEFAKSFLAHFSQVSAASGAGIPVVYLPQSIGPYPPGIRRIVLSRLSRFTHVLVRDDRSRRLLSNLPNVRRMPDLAVLALAENSVVPVDGAFDRPVAIAREIGSPGTYYQTLDAMAASGRFDWAVQASARGNNDGPLSNRLANGAAAHARDVLDGERPRVVVSTRLHGALEALLRGYPAVHLGYERKSWGAFEDLGLQDYVLNCRRTSADEVLDRVAVIERDPDRYWGRVRTALGELAEESDVLDQLILSTQ